ncbi:GntR family transcriptional regulator [Curtobacterium sp. 24E2]
MTPPYQQIRAQLRTQILRGELLVGSRLPTVRRLAADLGVAINTVGRAYKELRSCGVGRDTSSLWHHGPRGRRDQPCGNA